jgi:hypothetical protein
MSEGLGATGSKSALNLTAATLVSVTSASSYVSRRIARVQVIVAGTVPGSVNDATTVAGAAVANQVFVIPNVAGSYQVEFPCQNGIVVTPGTGQTVAVSYD